MPEINLGTVAIDVRQWDSGVPVLFVVGLGIGKAVLNFLAQN
jgi:hypothetical protein